MPNNDDYVLGNMLQKNGRFAEAIDAYKLEIAEHPNFPWAYHALGDVYLKLEWWDRAVEVYEKAIELNPNFSWSYHNLGDAFLKLERWQKSADAYRCAIALKSDFAWSFCNFGDALTKLKQPDEAIVAYLQAVQLDRDLPGIYVKLGYVLGQTTSDLGAVLAAGKLQVTPEKLDLCLDIVNNLARYHRPQTALMVSNLLLTLFPDYYSVLAQLEELQKEQEKCDRALASARATVTSKPDDCWSYYNLGAVLSNQKYQEEAMEAFFTAIQINPDFPWWFYYNLWEVATEQDKLEKIEILYRKLVRAKPDAFWPYLNVGEALTRRDRIPEAIQFYKTASYNQTVASSIDKSGGKRFAGQDWDLKSIESPDFIIIGSQRCGTTSLYSYLAKHPQILTPIKKEMDFFSWHFDRGIGWYLAHFPQLPEGEQFLTGEASPSYFDCREAPQRLRKKFPQVKLIVLLRNPVDRAISHYYRLVDLNWESRSFDRAIGDEIERLNQNPENIIGEEPGNYIARGIYVEFIENWMGFFHPEQLLVLKSEDFYANPGQTVKEVLEFLELPDYQLPEYQNANPGFYRPVSQSMRNLLRDYFQPYNQQLEEYLRKKFDWE
ncbi:MAG: tetratricopeptide repeat protein [Oscillatoriaceae cyanobacterium Prado104]|jgi:tetratricopeptide (TPR) repeat protein|nr:tetratricopeptide repeat protein [Oscillatoriaceae cyanobacterium Prado104]